jgi:hypothetical protein
MEGFRYFSCHPMARARYGAINFASHSWTEVANGSGVLEGNITLPYDAVARELIEKGTRPDEAVIYRDSDTYGLTDGYIVTSRKWSPSTRTLSIRAAELRAWLYDVMLTPYENMSGDVNYSWSGVDQVAIAQGIVFNGAVYGYGIPMVDVPYTPNSGKLRDLNCLGTQFKKIGDLLDSMAQRAGGFEWGLIPAVNSGDGLPKWLFKVWYPERGSSVPGLRFFRVLDSGNFSLVDDPELNSASRYARVWTTGSTETNQYAVDIDPGLTGGSMLLREKSSDYSSVTERATLSAHARAERRYYASLLDTIKIRIHPDEFDVMSFRAGDRCRFKYVDEFLAYDLPAARIIERKISESATSSATIELTIDLNDSDLPESDDGGAV